MSWIATAVIGGTVIGAGSAYLSSSATRTASHEASAAATEATNAGIASQERMYQQSREDLAPYREAGYNALEMMGGMSPTGNAAEYMAGVESINPASYMVNPPNLPSTNIYGEFNPPTSNAANILSSYLSNIPSYPSSQTGISPYNALNTTGVGGTPTETNGERVQGPYGLSAQPGGYIAPDVIAAHAANATPVYTPPEEINYTPSEFVGPEMPTFNAPVPLTAGELPTLNLPEFQTPEFNALDPYYLWQQEELERSINRNAAARGLWGSRATMDVLARENRGLIAEESQKQYERAVDDYTRRYGAAIDMYNLQYEQIMAMWNQGFQVYQTQAELENSLYQANLASATSRYTTAENIAAERAISAESAATQRYNALVSSAAQRAAAATSAGASMYGASTAANASMANARTAAEASMYASNVSRANAIDQARYNAAALGLQVDSLAYNQYVNDYLINSGHAENVYNMNYGSAMDLYNLLYGQNTDLYNRTYGQGIDLYNMASQIGAGAYGQQVDLANLGAGAAANSATGAIQTGQGIASSYNALGNTQAQGILGAGQAQAGFYGGLANTGTQIAGMGIYNALTPTTTTPTATAPNSSIYWTP